MVPKGVNFKDYGLGLAKGELRLSTHNPKWFEAFKEVKGSLNKLVGDQIIELHHIGSTAIPGINAKPVLDILGVTPSIEKFDQYQTDFESAGFTWKGEYGIAGRRYLVISENDVSYVHLHVFVKGSEEMWRHLAFVEYLKSHPQVAAEYEALKVSLVQSATAREQYSEKKTELINSILRLARSAN